LEPTHLLCDTVDPTPDVELAVDLHDHVPDLACNGAVNGQNKRKKNNEQKSKMEKSELVKAMVEAAYN
jgi:hypothetical protein